MAVASATVTNAPGWATDTETPTATASTPAELHYPAGVEAPPEVGAQAWLIADITTGDIVASKNPHQKHSPASTLKTLTALALISELDPDAVHTATHEEAAIEGSKVGLVEDGEYTIDDLLHGLILNSGNDTALALAHHAGGIDHTVDRMNQLAAELGAADTHAENTSGLDAPGQVTTAYDLVLIAQAALADPTLANIMTTKEYQFPGKGTGFGEDRERFAIANHNKLVHNDDGATGVKTGYTVASRHTYIGSATRGDHHYVVAMLRSETRPWQDTIALVDWAASIADTAEPVGHLPKPGEEATTVRDNSAPTEAAAWDGPRQDAPSVNDTVSGRTQYLIGAGLLVAGIIVAFVIARTRTTGR